MALVTQTLLEQIRKQVEAHSTVVWYDPEETYVDLARSMTPEAVACADIYCYDPEEDPDLLMYYDNATLRVE